MHTAWTWKYLLRFNPLVCLQRSTKVHSGSASASQWMAGASMGNSCRGENDPELITKQVKKLRPHNGNPSTTSPKMKSIRTSREFRIQFPPWSEERRTDPCRFGLESTWMPRVLQPYECQKALSVSTKRGRRVWRENYRRKCPQLSIGDSYARNKSRFFQLVGFLQKSKKQTRENQSHKVVLVLGNVNALHFSQAQLLHEQPACCMDFNHRRTCFPLGEEKGGLVQTILVKLASAMPHLGKQLPNILSRESC